MFKRLLVVLPILFTIFSISLLLGGTSTLSSANKNAAPFAAPAFTSTSPTSAVVYDRPFTYNFSATDDDLDAISFYTVGASQLDANFQGTGSFSATPVSSYWQSFTAVNTGLMVDGSLYAFHNNPGNNITVKIYDGEGTSGTLLYTTTIFLPNSPFTYQHFSVPVSANVLLKSGQVYTINFVSPGANIAPWLAASNPYSGGRSSANATWDNLFTVNIKPLTTTPTATWLSLTDNGDGTGSLTGTPSVSNAGAFSETLIAQAGTDYIQQAISFTIGAAPVTVSNVTAIAGNASVELKWSKNSDSDFSKYYIYGGTTSNPTTLIDSTENINDTTKIISELINGNQYFFRIRTKTAGGYLNDYSAQDAVVPVSGAGNSLSLVSSSNQKVTISSNLAPLGNSNYTIEAWIKPNSIANNGIIGWGTYSSSNAVNAFRLGTGGYLINYWWGNDITANIGDISGNWHHVAATFDGTTRRLFLDGNEVASDTPVGHNVTNNANLTIGVTNGNEYFNGEIDEVRFWNYARTESEIHDNAVIPLRGDESGLVALYHFDEASGTTAYDATINAKNGTLVNNPTFVSSGALNAESLPVELTSFSFSGNKLLWSTATETNNAGWEVEIRGAGNKDEGTWKSIGFISGKGTTVEKQNYVFSVSGLQSSVSIVEFRLKQIDSDGKISFSNILSVNLTPETYSLSQNYPNPFNPTTAITYQLSALSNVKLVVYDLLGREIRTLVNQEKPAGSYSIDFSAADLPSGVYFYKLTAGKFSETKKMTVVK